MQRGVNDDADVFVGHCCDCNCDCKMVFPQNALQRMDEGTFLGNVKDFWNGAAQVEIGFILVALHFAVMWKQLPNCILSELVKFLSEILMFIAFGFTHFCGHNNVKSNGATMNIKMTLFWKDQRRFFSA